MSKTAKFRLESLMVHSAAQEDRASAALRISTQLRLAAERALLETCAALELRLVEYAASRTGQPFSARGHGWHWDTLQTLREECAQRDHEIVAARSSEARDRAAFLEVHQRHEMLLELRRRHSRKTETEQRHQEEMEAGDFANAQYAATRRSALA